MTGFYRYFVQFTVIDINRKPPFFLKHEQYRGFCKNGKMTNPFFIQKKLDIFFQHCQFNIGQIV